MSFLARRVGLYLVAAWASLTLNFLIPRLLPGDPAAAIVARFRGQLGPQAIAALRETYGVSEAPLAAQYLAYLGDVLRGDLGTSVAYFPEPVTSVIASGLGWTLFLAGTAVVLAFVLGTLLGALAAWRRGGWLDAVATPALVFLGAFPYFWLAMLALWLFGFTLGWTPVRHAYGDAISPDAGLAYYASVVRHALLPAATIVIATLGGWMLGMRNTMGQVLREPYVTLARAKGLAPARVFFHYAARNALLPNVTGFGMALGFVLSGSILTEVVFSYPGQGYLLVQAVRQQDYPLMQGLFLTLTLAVLAANAIVDVITVLLDPRARIPAGGRA